MGNINNHKHAPTISACLIVKNEAHCLNQCLDSLKELVDEIVIVDTGSTDETLTIARRYTDKIFYHEWQDHFSDARNAGLAQATGDWILVLDADEAVDAETARLIPAYLAQPKFQGRPLVLNWHMVSSKASSLFKRGLFPNGLGIEFAGRVHETLVLPGQELSYYHCPELIVHHCPTEAGRGEKHKYYQRLLQQSLEEEKDLTRVTHIQKHLGLNHLTLQEWLSAWHILVACYQGLQSLPIPPQDGFYGEVLRGLVQAGAELGYSDASRFEKELYYRFPSEPVPEAHHSFKLRPSLLKQVLIAGSLSALAACQASSTSPLSHTITPQVVSSINPSESAEALRARYGPFTRIGVDYPEFKNYLSQTSTERFPGSAPLLSVPDFTVQGYDFSQCSGTYGGFTYNSIGSIRDAQLQCGNITYVNFDAVNQCYSHGGVPVWIDHQICTPQGPPDGSFCFETTEQAELLACNGVSPTPTPPPLPTPAPSSSLPPGSNPDWSLTVDKEWFSPNGDGVKDSVEISVHAIYPWMVKIKKNGQILKQYTGQSSSVIGWNGAEARGQEGKYSIVLVPPRFQSLEKDKKEVGIDLTPPNISTPQHVSNKQGRNEITFSVEDPLSNGVHSGVDPSDVQVNLNSDNLQIASAVPNVKSDAKIDFTAPVTDIFAQLASSLPGSFTTASINGGFQTLSNHALAQPFHLLNTGSSSIVAIDRAGNKTSNSPDLNNAMCLAPQTREQMKQAYQDILQEINNLITEIQKPGVQTAASFQVAALNTPADFSIQALVKCEPGECDTPIIAGGIVEHGRALKIQELEMLEAWAHVSLAYETRYDGLRTALLTGVEAAAVFYLPVGIEVGGATLAFEMEQYLTLLGNTNPFVLAYLISNNGTYHVLLDLLQSFSVVVSKQLAAVSSTVKELCVRPTEPGEALRFQRGMVDFTNNFRRNIVAAGAKDEEGFLLRKNKLGEYIFQKDQLPAHTYFKNPLSTDPTNDVIGKMTVLSKPKPHEVPSAEYLAQQGKDVVLVGDNVPEPDLKIRPFGSNSPYEIWDLKGRLNPSDNPKSALANLIKQTGNSKSNQYFIDLGVPHKAYIDARLDISSSDAINYFHDYLTSTSQMGDAVRGYLGYIDELRIITSDEKVLKWVPGSQTLTELP